MTIELSAPPYPDPARPVRVCVCDEGRAGKSNMTEDGALEFINYAFTATFTNMPNRVQVDQLRVVQ